MKKVFTEASKMEAVCSFITCGGDFGFIFAGEFTGGEHSLGRMVCGEMIAHAYNQCDSG